MKMKKRLLALLLAAVLVMSLTGCKETLKNVAQKVTGSSNQVQEEDTTRWADATSDQLIIQGIADASAKFDTAVVDGTLYAVFNGIWTRQTSYFTVPSGTLNIMGRRGHPEVQGGTVEKGGRRCRVCAGQHLLYQDRRPELHLHRLRAGPGGAVPGDHLL